ncbi:hypothetical protein [Comamonas thiooxydans]|nr:hypothetical protein [Comamonas thiooxydans]
MLLKTCFVVLLSLLTSGCFNDDDQEEKPVTASARGVAEWNAFLHSKEARVAVLQAKRFAPSDDESASEPAPASRTSTFNTPPLFSENIFDPLNPNLDAQRQSENGELALAWQLNELARTDAQSRLNYAVTGLKDSVDQLQSHADASAVAQVRIRFNELERANQALSSADADASMRNRHELERIGMSLKRIEDAQSWAGLKR